MTIWSLNLTVPQNHRRLRGSEVVEPLTPVYNETNRPNPATQILPAVLIGVATAILSCTILYFIMEWLRRTKVAKSAPTCHLTVEATPDVPIRSFDDDAMSHVSTVTTSLIDDGIKGRAESPPVIDSSFVTPPLRTTMIQDGTPVKKNTAPVDTDEIPQSPDDHVLRLDALLADAVSPEQDFVRNWFVVPNDELGLEWINATCDATHPVVASVAPSSPLWERVWTGDVLLAVDRDDAAGWTSTQVEERMVPGQAVRLTVMSSRSG